MWRIPLAKHRGFFLQYISWYVKDRLPYSVQVCWVVACWVVVALGYYRLPNYVQVCWVVACWVVVAMGYYRLPNSVQVCWVVACWVEVALLWPAWLIRCWSPLRPGSSPTPGTGTSSLNRFSSFSHFKYEWYFCNVLSDLFLSNRILIVKNLQFFYSRQMLLIRIGDVVYKGPRASFFMLHTNTTRKRLAGPTKIAEEVLQYVEIFI